MNEEKKTHQNNPISAYRIGLTILIMLGAFTVGEFFIGKVAPTWAAVMLAIAALKAFFVIRDYMHIGRVFTPEDEVN